MTNALLLVLSSVDGVGVASMGMHNSLPLLLCAGGSEPGGAAALNTGVLASQLLLPVRVKRCRVGLRGGVRSRTGIPGRPPLIRGLLLVLVLGARPGGLPPPLLPPTPLPPLAPRLCVPAAGAVAPPPVGVANLLPDTLRLVAATAPTGGAPPPPPPPEMVRLPECDSAWLCDRKPPPPMPVPAAPRLLASELVDICRG